MSIYDDPFTVAGLPATSGPTGLRPYAKRPDVVIRNTDNGKVDHLAAAAFEDLRTYWQTEYPKHFGGSFPPVGAAVSWDSGVPGSFCDQLTAGFANAGYCTRDNTIGWDRTHLLPSMIHAFGEIAVMTVLAHEYGHAVQKAAATADAQPGIVLEQQADCFAGAFVRHVAEGNAAHFTINTSDGLNSVLAAIIALRDADPNDPGAVHGSAFERVTAVQIGFADGPGGCARIDEREIDSRRGALPQLFAPAPDSGGEPVTKQRLDAFVHALHPVFGLERDPVVDYTGTDVGCGTGSAPVSYCPATHTIGVDLPALIARGTPQRPADSDLPQSISGDYNAFVALGSRYVLATQRDLKGPKAALRTACLSGVFTAAFAHDGSQFELTSSDLDEAVSGLLTDGFVASDVDGNTVPSGFARIDAFRTGVLSGRAACESRYD